MSDVNKRPQYGELLDNDGQMHPLSYEKPAQSSEPAQEQETSAQPHSDQQDPTAANTPAAAPRSDAAFFESGSALGATPQRLPGIPHNLGVDRAANAGIPLPPQQSELRAAKSVAEQNAAEQPAEKQQLWSTANRVPKNSAGAKASTASKLLEPKFRTDRMATFLLLGVGAISGFSLAQSLFALQRSGQLLVSALDRSELTVPSFIGPLGQASALALILLWVAALFWSLARVKVPKLAFWVPLVIGVTAVVFTVAVTGIMLFNTLPADVLADPAQMQELINKIYTQSSP